MLLCNKCHTEYAIKFDKRNLPLLWDDECKQAYSPDMGFWRTMFEASKYRRPRRGYVVDG